MNDDLEYISSAADFKTPGRDVKPQDETDLTTLERVFARLDKYIEEYNSNDALTADEAQFSVREQLVLNQRSVLLARELKLLVETTVSDIKEKNRNG